MRHGNIPDEWDFQILNGVCERITDGSHYSPKEEPNNDYKIATVADIECDRFDLNSCKKISGREYEQLVKNGCKPNVGDVLFSKDGTVGLSFVFKQDANLVLLSSIAIISTKRSIFDPEFCSFILKSPTILREINDKQTGSAISRIVLKDLKKIKIPLPPISEQRKIANILSSVDKAIEKTDAIIAKTERVNKGLMQELFTDCIERKVSK